MLWLGLLPATMSFQMGVVVRPYVAYALTGSAAALGLVSLANGGLSLGSAWLSGRVKVLASLPDLLRLRTMI